MVTYKLTDPVKQGDIWVLDVIEKIGGSIFRRKTIRVEQAEPFLKGLFRTLPEPLQKKIDHNKDIIIKKSDGMAFKP